MATTDNTPTPSDSRSELMFLGKECHHPACHLHDFLPFSCPACKLSFCQPHFLPSQHSCKSPLPPSMVDRIAPTCPLCNQVVPTAKSLDPNESVDRHILDGICVGLPGGEEKRKAELKAKKERGEVCWRKGCSKNLVVKMRCESCNHSFCPPHRHASSHMCTPTSSRTGTPALSGAATSAKGATASGSSGAKSAMSRLMPSKNSSTGAPPASSPVPVQSASPTYATPTESKPLDVRAAAAAAAMKRAGEKANVPFVKTKTEKRANAEASSQLQALKNRHDKGLLTKAEELKYAELLGQKESGRRKSSKDKEKDGCIVA